MRALVLSEGYNLSIKEITIPQIENNEVLIKVQAVGICGSDVHGYDGSTGRRIPPIIMGHELSGIIEKTTKNSSFQVGDHVTAHSTIYCGKCIECKNKNFSICNNRKVIGVSCKSTHYTPFFFMFLNCLMKSCKHMRGWCKSPLHIFLHCLPLIK